MAKNLRIFLKVIVPTDNDDSDSYDAQREKVAIFISKSLKNRISKPILIFFKFKADHISKRYVKVDF